jgi:hypothetical protein
MELIIFILFIVGIGFLILRPITSLKALGKFFILFLVGLLGLTGLILLIGFLTR